jgi:hypothetical protein
LNEALGAAFSCLFLKELPVGQKREAVTYKVLDAEASKFRKGALWALNELKDQRIGCLLAAPAVKSDSGIGKEGLRIIMRLTEQLGPPLAVIGKLDLRFAIGQGPIPRAGGKGMAALFVFALTIRYQGKKLRFITPLPPSDPKRGILGWQDWCKAVVASGLERCSFVDEQAWLDFYDPCTPDTVKDYKEMLATANDPIWCTHDEFQSYMASQLSSVMGVSQLIGNIFPD